MKLCHLKDDSETSTRADRQNTSVVRTLFNLFLRKKQKINTFINCIPFVYRLVNMLYSEPDEKTFISISFCMSVLVTPGSAVDSDGLEMVSTLRCKCCIFETSKIKFGGDIWLPSQFGRRQRERWRPRVDTRCRKLRLSRRPRSPQALILMTSQSQNPLS